MKDRISINEKMKCVRVCKGGRHPDQEYFTEKQYGTMDAAYRAAVKYEESLPEKFRKGRIKPQKEPYRCSQSGIVGVHPYLNHGGDHAGWRASWTQLVDGKRRPKTKDFSFFRYGNNALDKAITHRKKMVKEHM